MPAWVLLVTSSTLEVPKLENEVRISGFSPRTAPDLARMRVLLAQGEDPAAAVVDLVSTGEEGLRAIEELAAMTRVVAIAPSGLPDMGVRAERFGATVVADTEADDFLQVLLPRTD